MHPRITAFLLSLTLLPSGCFSPATPEQVPATSSKEMRESMTCGHPRGIVPDGLGYAPEGYTRPAGRPGTLEKPEDGLSFREREGYSHDGNAANEYMYNALRFFWNP